MLRARAEEAEQTALRLAHRAEQAGAWLQQALEIAREVRVEPEYAQDLADALVFVVEAQMILEGR